MSSETQNNGPEKTAGDIVRETFFTKEGLDKLKQNAEEGRISDDSLKNFLISFTGSLIDGKGLSSSFKDTLPGLGLDFLYDGVFIVPLQKDLERAINENRDPEFVAYLEKEIRKVEFDKKLSASVLGLGMGLGSLLGGFPAGAAIGFTQGFSNLNEILTSPRYADVLAEKAPGLIAARQRNDQIEANYQPYANMFEHQRQVAGQFADGKEITFAYENLRDEPLAEAFRPQENGIDLREAVPHFFKALFDGTAQGQMVLAQTGQNAAQNGPVAQTFAAFVQGMLAQAEKKRLWYEYIEQNPLKNPTAEQFNARWDQFKIDKQDELELLFPPKPQSQAEDGDFFAGIRNFIGSILENVGQAHIANAEFQKALAEQISVVVTKDFANIGKGYLSDVDARKSLGESITDFITADRGSMLDSSLPPAKTDTGELNDLIMTAQSVYVTAETVSCQVAAYNADKDVAGIITNNIAVSIDNIAVNTSADNVEGLADSVIASTAIQNSLESFTTGEKAS